MSRKTKPPTSLLEDVSIDDILSSMSPTAMQGTVEVQIPEKILKAQRSSPFDKVLKNFQDMLQYQQGREIELSFGIFEGKKFIPGVSRAAFLRVLKALGAEEEEVEHSVVSISSVYDFPGDYKGYVARRIERNGIVKHELKKRLQYIPNPDYGFRISLSNEVDSDKLSDSLVKYLEDHPQLFSFQRRRERISVDVDGIRVDLTKINSGKNYIYEIEIEIVENKQDTADRFISLTEEILEAIQPPFGQPCLVSDVVAATIDINKILRPRDPPSSRFKDTSLVRPINLVLDDLLTKSLPAITLKLDGQRAILYACSYGIFMFVAGEANYLGNYTGKETVLDGEFYENTYYAFDCIYHDSPTYDLPFQDRIAHLGTVVNVIRSLNIQIEEKKYMFSRNATEFYSNLSELITEVFTNEEKYDGIIFQPTGGYFDREPRKWKPSHRQTADFKVKAVPGGYSLYVTQTLPNGDYKIVPYSRFKYPIQIENAEDEIDGCIAEILIKYDNNEFSFEFKKYRNEKSRPNATFTVDDVYRDVKDPISDTTLTGEDTVLMRRFFNLEKKKLIETYFESLRRLGDVGSGQGGDIAKWINANISEVQCYDVSQEMINQFKSRLARMKSHKTKIEIHKIGFEKTNEVIRSLKGKVLDGITSFFSLTFFGKDEAKMDAMIDTVDQTLKSGGYFVGAVFDGDQVRRFMNDPSKVQKYENLIKIEGDAKGPLFGNEVVVNLGTAGETYIKDVKEYLFPTQTFLEKVKARGFRLLSSGQFDFPESLPPASQEWVLMNQYFVFVKGDIIEKKTKSFSFEDIGLSVGQAKQGPDNLIHALSDVLGMKLDSLRENASHYPVEEWVTLDGGQLAGGYQQAVKQEMFDKNKKLAALEELKVKSLGPKEYTTLGHKMWSEHIRNKSSFIGPRLGVELFSRILEVGIIVYNQLGHVEKIYFNQTKILRSYSKKVMLYYNGAHFTPLFPMGTRPKTGVMITAEKMGQFEKDYRNLANYLGKLDFPFIGNLVPIEEIRNFEGDTVRIVDARWTDKKNKVDENKIIGFEKVEDLPKHFDAASDPFMEERRLACNVKGFPSPIEYWNSVDRGALAKSIVENYKGGDLTIEDVHDAFYRIKDTVRICTEFHLSYAMGVMKYLLVGKKKPKVLDPCAGHGARLIAALKLGYGYTAFDPDKRLEQGHLKIIETFGRGEEPTIYYEPFDGSKLKAETFDLVFTSPPYFDYEIYSNDPSQSTTGNVSYNTWVDNFYRPMLQGSWRALKKGGYFAIHIQDIPTAELVKTTRTISDKLPGSEFSNLILLKGDSGRFRPVWVWKKK